MWLLQKTLIARPDLSSPELIDSVCPPSIEAPGQGGHVKRSLSALREFGLVSCDEDGLLRAEEVADVSAFIRLLRRRLVVSPSEVAQDFAGAPDLRKGLIWLMRQSPRVPLSWEANAQTELAAPFVNDTRWIGFRPWAGALGFSQTAISELYPDKSGRGKVRIVPNPTAAVLDAIRRPFGPPLPISQPIPITQLLAHIRSEIPVLPGHPSAEYEGLSAREDDMGTALAFALVSAESRGLLKMEYESDPTGATALPDSGITNKPRYVSTVTIGAETK
jgi:hypothetical protein